jgi:hypothetical protein
MNYHDNEFPEDIKMYEHYEQMVKDTDARVKKTLRIQNMHKGSAYYGAVPEDSGIYQAKSTIYKLTALIAAYVNKDSLFRGDFELIRRINACLDYIEACQHENGLFDYVTCNFFSAPDTAFCIKKLVPTYELLKAMRNGDCGKYADLSLNETLDTIFKRIDNIVCSGAKGLLQGGFHTPNHRWAIASMLAYCGMLFNDPSLTEGANAYLAEGIDCNEDGEFSEKSAGNYNRINNDAMIMLSEAFKDDSYEQYAIRNLRMMLTYFEPDDSVFTANSTRFDKDRLIFPKDYYLEYLKMGLRHDIPEFLDMANRIFEIVREKGISSPDFLTQMMLNPQWIDLDHIGSGYPTDYSVFYKGSSIARTRRGDLSFTVLGGKSNFLYVHNRSIKLEMKVAGSFCEHRAFKSETMERRDDGAYVLKQTMRGWYYLPFSEKPETSDWWKMDNASREKKLGPDMQIEVVVKEAENGVDVDVKTSGVNGAPWRIELAFSGIDRISNDHMSIPVHGDEVLVLRDSSFEALNREDVLSVGPAFGKHEFTEGKEDSEAKNPGSATVYLTDYTPFEHTISIRNGKAIL